MFFEFLKANGPAASDRQDDLDAEPLSAESATAENNLSEKASSAEKQPAEKKSAAQKESSLAAKDEVESRKDRLKKQSNRKVECRNPDCTESAIYTYDSAFDAEGDATVSYQYCLNCGFDFPYFEKFEKESKKADEGDNLGVGFAFLVATLFVVIVIKGEQGGRLFNRDAPPTNNQGESLRSPQTDTSPQREYPVLNDPENPSI